MMNLTGLNESEATKPKQKPTVSGKDKQKCTNIAESSKDYLFLLIPRDFSTLQTLRFLLRLFSSFSEKTDKPYTVFLMSLSQEIKTGIFMLRQTTGKARIQTLIATIATIF